MHLNASCGTRGQMVTAETLHDLARSHIDVHAKGKGGNTKFTCNHCSKEYTGSLTRQLAHLIGESGVGIAACQDISSDQREGIKIEKRALESTAAPAQATWRKLGAPVRAPGAERAGAPHPHECNYGTRTLNTQQVYAQEQIMTKEKEIKHATVMGLALHTKS